MFNRAIALSFPVYRDLWDHDIYGEYRQDPWFYKDQALTHMTLWRCLVYRHYLLDHHNVWNKHYFRGREGYDFPSFAEIWFQKHRREQ